VWRKKFFKKSWCVFGEIFLEISENIGNILLSKNVENFPVSLKQQQFKIKLINALCRTSINMRQHLTVHMRANLKWTKNSWFWIKIFQWIWIMLSIYKLIIFRFKEK
jgi:hypothetical protein